MSVDPKDCTISTCPLSEATVDYIPSLAGNVIYCVVFLLILFTQIGLGLVYRTWTYTSAMSAGLILEIVGYIGRIMMHNNPFDSNAFLIYLICLTIAPVFITAAIYVCCGRIVTVYGLHNSRFKAKTYTVIFMTSDFISLLLQAAGGAIADTANTKSSEDVGIDIMIAGLVFQVVSLIVFVAVLSEFAWRVKKNGREHSKGFSYLAERRSFKYFMIGLGVATFLIIIRSLFRVFELNGGFNSSLANNEAMLMIFDGLMMTVASIVLTAFHPGVAFDGWWIQTSSKQAADAMGQELKEHSRFRPSKHSQVSSIAGNSV